MLDKWWPRRRRAADLSAFADGELTGSAADRVAEHLVFDAHERDSLSRLRQMDKLLVTALPAQLEEDPDPVASAETSADAILARPETVIGRDLCLTVNQLPFDVVDLDGSRVILRLVGTDATELELAIAAMTRIRIGVEVDRIERGR